MFNHFLKYSAWRFNNVKCNCTQGIKLKRSPRSDNLSRIRHSFTKTGDDWTREIFENLRFRPSTRIRKVSVFESLHSGDHFRKPPFSVTEYAVYVWTEGKSGQKAPVFKNIRIRVDGALFWGSCTVVSNSSFQPNFGPNPNPPATFNYAHVIAFTTNRWPGGACYWLYVTTEVHWHYGKPLPLKWWLSTISAWF